jgi:hypothetical protein
VTFIAEVVFKLTKQTAVDFNDHFSKSPIGTTAEPLYGGKAL